MTTEEKINPSSAARTAAENREPYGARQTGLLLTGPALRLELVQAHREPEIAAACYRNKQACYARFGAAAASVPLSERIEDEDLHLITATDCDSGTLVGSVSIYRRNSGMHLPIERAIGNEPTMRDEIATWQGRRIAEMSGLWAEEIWRKTGLSEQLLHAAIAACHVLRVDKIVAFGHQHLVSFYETVGLLPELRLGRFRYPNPEYVSTVLWADPSGFLTVPVDKRPKVLGFAKAIAGREPILWHSFKERFALE